MGVVRRGGPFCVLVCTGGRMVETGESCEPLGEMVAVRFTKQERQRLEIGAERAGCTLSELVRTGARRMALEAIGEAALAEEEA